MTVATAGIIFASAVHDITNIFYPLNQNVTKNTVETIEEEK